MAILYIKNAEGKYVELPVIKGDTPIKGIDYFTDEDIAEIVEQIEVAAPVNSVNGKTGKVILTAADVGAVTEIQVNELINDALGVIENGTY